MTQTMKKIFRLDDSNALNSQLEGSESSNPVICHGGAFDLGKYS